VWATAWATQIIYALSRLDYGTFETIKIRDNYQERRDVLVDGLNAAGWPVQKPQGSMFLWAKIPERFAHMTSLEFAQKLMEKALVAVSPGIGFGPMGEGHVRF
jgi:alanine-synthesizing transaminase